jgi:uncharacterized protein (TIGR03435 family)
MKIAKSQSVVRKLATGITAGLLLGTALAQTPSARLEFEVASIKPAEGLIAGRPASGGTQVDGAQVHLNGYMLRSLITMAYNLKWYQVIGPDWLTLRFQIDAKLPAGAARSQVPEMVQSLLADRFQMKFHNQPKELPVYGLMVSAGGTKLQDQAHSDDPPDPNGATESKGYGGPGRMGAANSDGSSYSLENNKLECLKYTMTRLAGLLSTVMDRPVIDMTGLKGRYDFSFPVSADDLHSMIRRAFVGGGGSVSPEALRELDEQDFPTLHAGLNSFGLKLEPHKSSVPVLVVDSILKSPTGN